MKIVYGLEPELTAEEFRDVLVESTLGERRPVHDLKKLDRMLRGADVIVTARDGDKLVGISRAITDFAYCCYLSDLAVAVDYQRRGIGKKLIEATQRAAGAECSLYLVPAPAAVEYYQKIGMQEYPCFGIPGVKLASV